MTWKFKKEAWASPRQGSLGQGRWGWHLPPWVWFMRRPAYAETLRNGIETDTSLFPRPVCGQMGFWTQNLPAGLCSLGQENEGLHFKALMSTQV